MGVDISGKDPIVRGVKPTIDWDTATEEERDRYWINRDAWDQRNPGDYFRASWWSWRPLAELIIQVNEEKELGIDTTYFGSNDGAGPDDQETCDRLADALGEKLTQLILQHPELTEDDDNIYLMLGSWVDENGQFISTKESQKITREFDHGQMMVTGFATENGLAYSAHSISLGHLKSFIEFLRECGGFEIW